MDEKALELENQKQLTEEETVTVSKGKFSQFMESLFGGTDKKDGQPEDKKGANPKQKDSPQKSEGNNFPELLAAEKAKWESEQAEKNRLSSLPAEEQAKAEMELYKQQLAQKDRLLSERQLKDEAIAFLSKEGYPVELADILNLTSAQTKETSLNTTISVVEKALETIVKQRLKGKTPAGLGGAASSENAIADAIAKNIRGGLN